MNNKLQLISIISLGAMVALLVGNNSALAQARVNDNNGYQSNEQDDTYGQGLGGLDPLELMHKAQQMNGRSAEEFRQESQGQINDSALKFKELQQQRILEQRQKNNQGQETVAE